MKKLSVLVVMSTLMFATSAYATKPKPGINIDDCNGVANCNTVRKDSDDNRGSHSGRVTGNTGITNAHSSDNNTNIIDNSVDNSQQTTNNTTNNVTRNVTNNVDRSRDNTANGGNANAGAAVLGSGNSANQNSNRAYGGQGGQGGAGGAGGDGGKGLGVGIGGGADVDNTNRNRNNNYADGGNADATANGGNVLGSGNSRAYGGNASGGDAVSGSASGVYGSGNSGSSSSSDTDVNASSRNTNIVGGGQGGQGGTSVSGSYADGGNARQGQQQGQGQGQAILGSGNSETTVTGGDVNGGDTVINIGNTGGEFGGEGQGGEGGTSPFSSSVGDTTATVGDATSDSSTTIGDTTLTNGSNSATTIGDTSLDNSNSGNNSSNVNEGNDVTVNIGEDGPLTASSQSVDASASVDEGAVQIDNSDNSVTTYEAPDIPVSTAATTFSTVCTSGAAAQRPSYGISLAVTSDVCMHLMMADAWVAMGDMDRALKSVKAAGRHASVKGFMGYIRHIVTIGIL